MIRPSEKIIGVGDYVMDLDPAPKYYGLVLRISRVGNWIVGDVVVGTTEIPVGVQSLIRPHQAYKLTPAEAEHLRLVRRLEGGG